MVADTVKTLYMYCGVPGSGKTWLANERHREIIDQSAGDVGPFSADDHFVDFETGEYEFRPEEIAIAHSRCQVATIEALENQGIAIVANTFVHAWERDVYIAAAHAMGANVEIVEIACDTVHHIRLCHERNTHGVPLALIARMAAEFESHDSAFGFGGKTVRYERTFIRG